MDENRFAPPGAVVEDVGLHGDGFQPIKLWPPSGRLGRLRLLAYSLLLYLAYILLSAVLGGIAGAAGMNVIPFIVIATIAYAVVGALLLIERSHDMNFSGWWSLAAIIPLAGLIWMFVPGTPGGNRWGAPPPANPLWVKIVGLLVPVIAVIGIVAAIALGQRVGLAGISAPSR